MQTSALSVAEKTVVDVQSSLDSTKHGSTEKSTDDLNIKYFMYYEDKFCKTVIITKPEHKYIALFKIYSKVQLKLMDIVEYNNSDCFLNLEKMALFCISIGEVEKSFNVQLHEEKYYIIDRVNNRHVRNHTIIRRGFFNVLTIKDDITFNYRNNYVTIYITGDYFKFFRDEGFEVFTTNTKKNVEYLGKNVCYHLYNKYIHGEDSKLFISKLLGGDKENAINYRTMDKDNIIKKLTQMRQTDTLSEIILRGKPKSDNLSSYESRIIYGKM